MRNDVADQQQQLAAPNSLTDVEERSMSVLSVETNQEAEGTEDAALAGF